MSDTNTPKPDISEQGGGDTTDAFNALNVLHDDLEKALAGPDFRTTAALARHLDQQRLWQVLETWRCHVAVARDDFASAQSASEARIAELERANTLLQRQVGDLVGAVKGQAEAWLAVWRALKDRFPIETERDGPAMKIAVATVHEVADRLAAESAPSPAATVSAEPVEDVHPQFEGCPELDGPAFAMIAALHEHLPEDKRPKSWSDFSPEQVERIKKAAGALYTHPAPADVNAEVVGSQVYKSAVRGRAEFRDALRRERARVSGLKAALEPFARKADKWEENHREDARDSVQVQHRLGDFRVARETISRLNLGEEK